MALQQEQIDRAVTLAKAYGATRLILFGSAMQGLAHARDLDLACDGVAGWKLYELGARLEEELRVPVDLIPLSPPTRLTKLIEDQGRVLVCANAQTSIRFSNAYSGRYLSTQAYRFSPNFFNKRSKYSQASCAEICRDRAQGAPAMPACSHFTTTCFIALILNRPHKYSKVIMKTSALSVAKNALPVFGFVGGSLSQLQSLVNTSFRVQHESGDWYLRVYNQHRRNRIEVESELLWMEALADAALAVPVPRRTVDGSLFWQSSTKLTTESYFVCVTSWLNGETIPGDKRNSLHYATLGRLLAQVHQHSISWKPPAGFSRPRCDATGIYRKLDTLVRQKSQDLDSQLKVELDEARNALLRAEKILKRDPERYGLLHGDPSFGNILFKDKTPLLLDFDDCGYGYFAYDLAVVLAGAWGKTGYDENRSALLNGYRTERSLIDAEIDTLPIMMAARAASLILWAIESSESSWVEGQRQRLREYMAID